MRNGSNEFWAGKIDFRKIPRSDEEIAIDTHFGFNHYHHTFGLSWKSAKSFFVPFRSGYRRISHNKLIKHFLAAGVETTKLRPRFLPIKKSKPGNRAGPSFQNLMSNPRKLGEKEIFGGVISAKSPNSFWLFSPTLDSKTFIVPTIIKLLTHSETWIKVDCLQSWFNEGEKNSWRVRRRWQLLWF